MIDSNEMSFMTFLCLCLFVKMPGKRDIASMVNDGVFLGY